MLNEVGIIVTVYAVKTNSPYITSGRLKRKSVSKKDIKRELNLQIRVIFPLV